MPLENYEKLIDEILVGWADPTAAMKEAGIMMNGFGEITRDHYNETIRISIEGHTEEKYLRTHTLIKGSEEGITLIIHFENEMQLKDILSVFVKYQDNTGFDYFQEFAGEILPLASAVEVETEDRLMSLNF
jgi:hypothetical protein